MSEAAIDYERQNALINARKISQPKPAQFHAEQKADNYDSQMPNAQRSRPADLRMRGAADNYNGSSSTGSTESQPQNFDRSSINKAGLRNMVRNKTTEVEKHLPHELREKLEEARQKIHDTKQLGGEAKTLVKSLTPWGLFSLIGKVNFLSDIPYFAALGAAILKDLLDLIGIGSLPAIGTVITILTSIFIGMMMFLGNMTQSEHDRTIFQSVILKQFGVLAFTAIVEFIFGLDLAPFQTVGVVFIYSFALAARKGRETVKNESF